MSQLHLFDKDSKEFKLNVTQFQSTMSSQINTVQVRKMLHHFPIRCGQPDINFTVHYASLDDKREFEAFVRKHQLSARDDSNAEVRLWWPERNISNWTGYIVSYRVAERRFQSAPQATFGVSLINSLMSTKTTLATRGIDVAKILGIQIGPYQGYQNDNTIIIPPSPPSAQNPPVNPQDLPRNAGDIPTPPLPVQIGR